MSCVTSLKLMFLFLHGCARFRIIMFFSCGDEYNGSYSFAYLPKENHRVDNSYFKRI